ncbi:MAG: hypothetical protein LJE96_16200 [Deltaproteobacteria bacterium]|nr:hypothetical protein [Deltaproteobacteria bacterium]
MTEKSKNFSIKQWPEGERPREKLIQFGAELLTDAELLAILLRIGFEIDGKATEIGWNSGTLTINGKERKTIGKTPLPDNVLIYYSGYNDTVAGLVEQYEEAFHFDFDKAYDQWNGLNCTVRETDPLKGMIKKWAEGESYALMLPVPANADIRKQVIRNTVFKSDGEKTVFAKEIAPTLAPACFEVFRPMFEFIKSKCPAGVESEDVAP